MSLKFFIKELRIVQKSITIIFIPVSIHLHSIRWTFKFTPDLDYVRNQKNTTVAMSEENLHSGQILKEFNFLIKFLYLFYFIHFMISNILFLLFLKIQV